MGELDVGSHCHITRVVEDAVRSNKMESAICTVISLSEGPSTHYR